MALLERINFLRQQGLNDTQIVTTLKQEGNSFNDINEAFSQEKIKAAIYSDTQNNNSEMQQSIMPNNQELPSISTSSDQVSSTAPMQADTGYNPSNAQYQAYMQEQQSAPIQENYSNNPNYNSSEYGQETYYSQGLDVETVREIAKQEIEEALRLLGQSVENLSKSKNEMVYQIKNLDERINKIESIIQEIQSAIIHKMGEYGEAIQGISQEVKATQDSFSKMINPLLDKDRQVFETEEDSTKIKPKSSSRVISKDDSTNFEDYFR